MSCAFDNPRLYILTSNQTIGCYDVFDNLPTGSSTRIATHRKLYTIKLQGQPLQLEIMKLRATKALLVALKQEIRIYNERMLVHKLPTEDPIERIRFGTYGRQENAVLIFYEGKGF